MSPLSKPVHDTRDPQTLTMSFRENSKNLRSRSAVLKACSNSSNLRSKLWWLGCSRSFNFFKLLAYPKQPFWGLRQKITDIGFVLNMRYAHRNIPSSFQPGNVFAAKRRMCLWMQLVGLVDLMFTKDLMSCCTSSSVICGGGQRATPPKYGRLLIVECRSL